MVYFPDNIEPIKLQLPEFEYDVAKSVANLEKHGIDFETAKRIWLDPQRKDGPARSEGEVRWMVVGQVEGKHWTAFVTYRQDRVRLISARRSRPSEVARYEHHD
ncbi:MAG: BrnT family toxin [Longimicrobiales bacterium]